MELVLKPIGFVRATRTEKGDDFWGGSEACIELVEPFTPEALAGIEQFSHVEIVFSFHLADPARLVTGARHPRNNLSWPKVGIFAQRGKDRPNHLGTTICGVVRQDGVRLYVSELDAIDGTPVLDIKPVMSEFLPRTEVRQPEWSHELMREYWSSKA